MMCCSPDKIPQRGRRAALDLKRAGEARLLSIIKSRPSPVLHLKRRPSHVLSNLWCIVDQTRTRKCALLFGGSGFQEWPLGNCAVKICDCCWCRHQRTVRAVH